VTPSPRRRQRLLVGALLLAFAILALGSLQRMSLACDEPAHNDYGRILNFDASRSVNNSKVPFSVLDALPRRLAPLLDPGRARHCLETVEFDRYMTLACTVLLGWLAYRWARALYGPGGQEPVNAGRTPVPALSRTPAL
jgi:hypothetical protein